MIDLHNQVAIVTGASREIGKAIARSFAENGVRVVLAGRTKSDLEAEANELASAGHKALAVPTDVAVVNISSLAGKNSIKDGAGYAATKWALRGFASSLMLEVREANVRVVTVFPGSVDTGFSMKNRRGTEITQPEDVASAVLFAVRAPGRSMFSEIDVRPTNPKKMSF